MISLSNITREFVVGGQSVFALRDVSLSIDAGEYVSIMGPSGSGKSTLLNIIGLLDRPNQGTYVLSGQNVTDMDADGLAVMRRQHIGFVFQFFHLIPRLTAEENVALPLMLAGVHGKTRAEAVDKALAAVGLSDRRKHKPDELSGGQRQRAAIARAVVMAPSIILADEPTGNLDRKSGEDVIHVLEKMNAEGITLLVVTHDPEIGSRARRRLLLRDGAVAEDKRSDALRA